MSIDLEKVTTSLDRVRKLEKWLQGEFVGDHFKDVICGVLLCAIADVPILLVGPPGGAKSLLVTRLFKLLSLKEEGDDNCYFQYLVHPFTQPEELLGAMNVDKFLNEKVFERNEEGSMVHESVRAIFLDEVFNANSAILNALLSLMNERVIYEQGKRRESRAVLIAGATNQVPQDHELQAFYDRFPVRHYVDVNVTSEDDLSIRIVERSCSELRERKKIGQPGELTQEIIDKGLPRIEDIELLQRALLEKYTSFEMVNETDRSSWNKLIGDLKGQDGIGVRLNGRTLGHLFRLASAHAMLRSSNGGLSLIQKADFFLPFQSIWHQTGDSGSLKESVRRSLGFDDYTG